MNTSNRFHSSRAIRIDIFGFTVKRITHHQQMERKDTKMYISLVHPLGTMTQQNHLVREYGVVVSSHPKWNPLYRREELQSHPQVFFKLPVNCKHSHEICPCLCICLSPTIYSIVHIEVMITDWVCCSLLLAISLSSCPLLASLRWVLLNALPWCRREIYHFPTRINQKFAKTLKQMYY